MPHDPTRTPPTDPPPPPVQPDRPGTPAHPAREVQDGAFDDSAAGEEDPGAGVDTLTPRPHAAQSR